MVRLKNTYLYLLLSTLAALWGCRKDVEEFIPYTPTQENLGQLLSQVADAATNTLFQFGGFIPDTTITTASGVRVFLADTENLFADDAGTPVPCSTCPALKVEVTTALRKSDILARGLPTTRYPDARMLESTGMVNVRVTCNGKALQLLPNRYLKIQIPANDVKANMNVYKEQSDQAPWQGWADSNSEAFWAEWPLPGSGSLQTGYELIVRNLGWNNCARPIDEQSSPFCVTLPEQFTALNARVFLVFKSVRAVAELTGDDATSEFCFPQAPIGYPVNVIVIGKTGGQLWLTTKFTEIGTNVQMPLTPQPAETQKVLDVLKNL